MEFLSFFLIVEHNKYQKTIFSQQTSSLFCGVSSWVTEVKSYFQLKETNKKLVEENTELRNSIEKLEAVTRHLTARPDTLGIENEFRYYPARMEKSSFNKTKNYIILNKGSADGVQEEMAVCSPEGVVGVIQNTSLHYAVVLPLINVNMRLSSKIKKNGYYGSLQWDGKDYRYAYLNDIPFHVKVEQGDTIVTSGFSSIFPEGELVGFVKTVDRETANFLSIKVRLAVDFKKIADVYVIDNRKKEEKRKLEAESYDEG